MKFSYLFSFPFILIYTITVKIKVLWHFRSKGKRKKHISNLLDKKFSSEGIANKKVRETLIDNYLTVGNVLLDKNLYVKLASLEKKGR